MQILFAVPFLENLLICFYIFISVNWLDKNLFVYKTIENYNYISPLAHDFCLGVYNNKMETPPLLLWHWELCFRMLARCPTNHHMGPRIKILILRLRAKSCTIITAAWSCVWWGINDMWNILNNFEYLLSHCDEKNQKAFWPRIGGGLKTRQWGTAI